MSSGQQPLILAKNISKSFPGVKALENVRLELYQGEVLALLGENGAGKSTLMKIISGIYTKDSGQIFIKGKEVEFIKPKDAQDRGIAIIHQELNLCPHMTVAENIFIGRELSQLGVVSKRRQNTEARKILKRLNVDINPAQQVSKLPISKRQMVEIAKAINLNAEILIMDEPTSALSEKEISDLFTLIRQLKTQGVGIIYISHRLEELQHIADRVTIMRDGHYVTTENWRDTSIDQIIKHMVGRNVTNKFPRLELPRGPELLSVSQLCSADGHFKDIHFNLYQGETLGIAGLMGAGRTELVKLIFGAHKIKSGNITLDGKALKIKTPMDAIRHGIVYVSEDRKGEGLCINMSVTKNIAMPNADKVTGLGGIINFRKEANFARQMIDSLKIKTPSIYQIVKNLSGGNQQKIVIGKWLVAKPRLFIFDEPTRGIDVGAKVEIYNILNSLKQQGIGVIVISSELPEVMGISDRIMVMCNNRITATLATKEASQENIMKFATQYGAAN